MSTPTIANPAGCSSAGPYGPPDYPTDAPLFRDPSSGNCYPINDDGEPERYAQYGYDPSLSVGIAFSVLFGLLAILHFALNIRRGRGWYWIVFIGALGEFGGWVARTVSGHDNGWTKSAADAFLTQIVLLTIVPVFFSGALYGLQVVIAYVHPLSSPFASRKLAMGFVAADVICLIIQSAGGGIASSATTQASQDTGTHLMVSGIVLQLVVLLVFSAIGLDMLRRGRKHPIANPQPGVDLRRLAIGMVIADLALIVRGIYRKSSSLKAGTGT